MIGFHTLLKESDFLFHSQCAHNLGQLIRAHTDLQERAAGRLPIIQPLSQPVNRC